DAEKGCRHVPVHAGIALPDEFPVRQFETHQLAFGAKSVAALPGEKRRGARSVIVTVRIDESAGIGMAPDGLAGGGLGALDHFLIAVSMVEHEKIAAHRRPAIASSGFLFPD